MKKVLNALFLTLLVALTFSACSDVPAPYDILTDGDLNIKGDGTKENPYDIAAASMKQDGSVAWVQGYIVGSAEGASLADGSKFEAPFTGASNILIADNPDEKDYKKCIPVQLVAATELRTKLNLVDNPANLRQVVTIKGTLENYFKQAGLKAPVAAVINDQEIGDGGGSEPSGSLVELLDPSNPVNEVINTFDDAATDVEYTKAGYVNFADAGARTWRGKPFNGNGLIQATAYGSKDASVISWFVTPAVNVAQMTSKKLTFDCISAYYKDGNKLEVYFLEKEGTTLKETLLNVGTLPQNAEGYSEAKTLSADLSSLSGKTGFIGFKYVGSSTASGTYQIDNLYVGVEPGENPGPGPGPDPVGDGTKEKPYDVATAASLSTATGTATAWVKGYIVGSVNADNASSSVDGPEDIIFGVTGIRATALVIAGSATETDYKKCLVIGFGSDSNAAKAALNLSDHPDNLGKEVLLYGVLKYAFSAPGMKTITEYEFVSGGGTDPKPSNNLVLNPGFEDWTAALPTSWDNAATTGITKETTIVHGGSASVKQDATQTRNLRQEVEIEAGKTYRISYWYLDNTPNAKSRPWIFWLNGTTTLADHVDDLRPNTYSIDNSAWQQFTKTLVAPATANKLRFEVRTYKEGDNSGFSYFDDFEVVEVTN